jgi:hypothetical protein
VVAAYTDNDLSKPVDLVKSGTGGVEELKNELKPDAISYALVRVVDKVDGHETIKFVFINFIGEKVSPHFLI